jgi:hypothetical protein
MNELVPKRSSQKTKERVRPMFPNKVIMHSFNPKVLHKVLFYMKYSLNQPHTSQKINKEGVFGKL